MLQVFSVHSPAPWDSSVDQCSCPAELEQYWHNIKITVNLSCSEKLDAVAAFYSAPLGREGVVPAGVTYELALESTQWSKR